MAPRPAATGHHRTRRGTLPAAAERATGYAAGDMSAFPGPCAAGSGSSSGSGLTRFALRGSARLAYDPGETTDAAASVVVLLHDLLADRTELMPLRAALTGAPVRFRVVAPDARGHGASAALTDRRVTLADLAADVLAVLDAEGATAAHLVGHGLGGAIACAVARAAPERVRSLTLVEPALWGMLAIAPAAAARIAMEELRASARAAADAAYKGLTDQALNRWLNPRWGEGWRERLPRPRLTALRRHAGALAPALTALDAYAIDPDGVKGIAMPTLVVHGETAAPVARVTGERLAARLPAGRLATIPAPADPAAPLAGAAGAALAALLVAFLAEIERTDRTGTASAATGIHGSPQDVA